MAISSGIAGTPPDLNTQVDQLAKMALQSGDHMGFFKQYLNPANPMRLAAQLAQGLVQQQMQGAETQQHLNQPQPPTVLDQKEQEQYPSQQGMAGMPTARGMFDPSVYAQGGIGAGLEEPQGQEQGQAQMARGGIVAFAGEGPSLVGAGTGSSFPFDITPAEFDKLPKEKQVERLNTIRTNERIAAELKTPQQPILPETPETKLAREARISGAQERIDARTAAEARPAASEVNRPGPTQPVEPPPAPNQAELKAAKDVSKLDGKIENAINKGKDPTKLIEQRRVLTEGINAGRAVPTVPASGIAAPGPTTNATVRAVTPGAQAPTLPPAAAPAAAAPAAPAPAAPAGGGVPPQAPPPGATAAPAAPGTPPPGATAAPGTAAPAAKPSLMQRGFGAIKSGAGAIKTGASNLTGIGTPAGQMGVARTVLNRAGVLGMAVGTGAYVGDALKDTSGAKWLQSLITPEPPEGHDANLMVGKVTSPETAKITYDAVVQRESNNMQLYPKGHPKEGQPVTSSKGAIGVGQVMPGTGPEAARLAGLPWDEERYKNDRDYNYAIGQAYFYKQLDTFKGSVPSALAAYNAGPAVVQSYLTGKPVRLKDGRIINPEGKKTPNGIPPYGETEKYVTNIQGRIDKQLIDKAKYAPEKGNVVRGVEMVQANLPQSLGGTGGPGGNAAQRFQEDLGDDPFRGVSAAGVGDVFKAIPKVASGVRDAFMGPPAPAPDAKSTVQQQYADILKNQQAAAPAAAPATAPDDKIFGIDRGRLSNILMQSGAAGLANPSQYASVSLGKGLQAGLAADQAREGKLAERAFKAEESAKTRAEKQYEVGMAYQKAELSKRLPQLDNIEGANQLFAQVATFSGMSPEQRRRQGTDDATYKQMQRQAAAIMAQIQGSTAGGKGNASYKPTDAQQAALNKYAP